MNKIVINKEEVLLLTEERGFFYYAPQGEGYKIFNAYIQHNLLERFLREIFFKSSFLPHKIWYNKKIKKEKAKYILVSDPLITKEYLIWLHDIFPNAQLNFTYGNMVGRASHILPDQIPSYYRIWTYDEYDSKTYGLKLSKVSSYFNNYIKPKEKTEYDVLYVGADKGRGEYLLQLETKMREMGLRTKFVITAVRRTDKKKAYYQKRLDYLEIIDLIVKSKAILNVALENQKGITVRDMESLFFDVKLLTTNSYIKQTDIYHPNNVFLIDGLNLDGLKEFIELPHVPISDEIKHGHTYDRYIEEIITTP